MTDNEMRIAIAEVCGIYCIREYSSGNIYGQLAGGDEEGGLVIIKVVRHKTEFTILSNLPFEDRGLSFKAKGILAYLLTRKGDWVVIKGQEPSNRSSRLPQRPQRYARGGEGNDRVEQMG